MSQIKSTWVRPVIPSLMAFLFFSLGLSACSGTGTQSASGTGAPVVSSANSSASNPELKRWMDQGNTEAKARRWTSAATAFQRALSVSPNHAPAHVQLGWVNAELKQWDEAKTHLIKALELSPDNAGAHSNLAWVYAEKERWNDAQTEARKAIDLDPKNAYAHATLAWAYQKTNQEALAVSEYEKSIDLNPSLENSRFAVGMSHCNLGNTARAKEQLTWLRRNHSSQASALQTRVAKGCYPKK